MGFSRNGGLSGVSDSMTLALEEHLFPNNCNPTGFFVPTKFQDLQLHMLPSRCSKCAKLLIAAIVWAGLQAFVGMEMKGSDLLQCLQIELFFDLLSVEFV